MFTGGETPGLCAKAVARSAKDFMRERVRSGAKE